MMVPGLQEAEIDLVQRLEDTIRERARIQEIEDDWQYDSEVDRWSHDNGRILADVLRRGLTNRIGVDGWRAYFQKIEQD